jgi:outer membrane protein OmpA-like peptidoglycan-associated protein
LPESFTVLDDVAASLAEQPRVRIRIEGHTDSRGSPPENVILSQQRAIAIMNYLIAAGVDPTRLEYEGLGASRPIASNDTEAGRQANRRVEFRVVGSQSEVAP